MRYLICILFLFSAHCSPSMALADSPPFSLAMLDALFAEKNASSLEEILPFLPGELRSRYVVVEDSRGLQEADQKNPRIIMRSPGLFLSFNGGEGLRNGNTLEAIERRPDDGYEFRRYIFSKTAPIRVLKNEKLCLNCHGKEPKPLWSPFPFWPGVLGEGQSLTSAEEMRLREFSSRAETHPRYSYLLREENLEWALRSGKSPAWTMQEDLEKILAQLLAKQIFSASGYSTFRYGALASLILCENIHSYLPATYLWNQPSSLESHRHEILLDLARLEPAHKSARALQGPGTVEILSRLDWIAGELGFEFGRWGGYLESRRLIGTRMESLFFLIEELIRLDPTLELPRNTTGTLSLSPFLQKQLFGDDFSSTPEDAAEHTRVCLDLLNRIPKPIEAH